MIYLLPQVKQFLIKCFTTTVVPLKPEAFNLKVESMRIKIEQGISVVEDDANFHVSISKATHNKIQTHLMFSIYDILKEPSSCGCLESPQGKPTYLYQTNRILFSESGGRTVHW